MKYPSSMCSLIASVCLLSLLPTSIAQPAVVEVEVDVVIYGGTPGGIAAAVAAGKQGRDVLVVEPYRRVGGLTTNGLSHTDFHSHEGLSGAFLDFSRHAEQYYINMYGPGSAQAKECRRDTQVEPHVNQLVFERMLDTYPSIRVLKRYKLASVRTTNAEGSMERPTGWARQTAGALARRQLRFRVW